MPRQPHPPPDWSSIDTVCLDLDGTLLDQAYDNHIWGELLPQRFARVNSLGVAEAAAEIERRYAEHRGTLKGYCIEFWSQDLGVDIGALHRERRADVAWLPGAREFLERMRAAGKRLLLLTNSHPIALEVKHEQTRVLDYLDESVTSHEFGYPKEHPGFWRVAEQRLGFDPARSIFVDDNARVLTAASAAGIRWVYGVRHWDTRREWREHVEHPAVDGVADLVIP
jgi:putative hydrolase of the HAD superfamily